MTSDNSKKFFSPEGYNILFKKSWPKTKLAENIASIVEDGLVKEYTKLRDKEAPARGRLDGKKYFMETHSGCVTGKGGSNRFEEHLCMALWNRGKELNWSTPKTGNIQLLDYQFPLKAWQKDKGIGKVDLLGMTEGEQLIVIEAKVLNKDELTKDTPLFALMEGLRYTAIIQANLCSIIKEAKKLKEPKNILKNPPLLHLIAPESWWDYWKVIGTKGEWQKDFKELLFKIEEKLKIRTECFALMNLTREDITWSGPEKRKPEIESDPGMVFSLD